MSALRKISSYSKTKKHAKPALVIVQEQPYPLAPLEHDSFTKQGYTRGRSTTTFVMHEFEIKVEKTSIAEMPPSFPRRKRRLTRFQRPVSEWKPGKSKYPFAQMEVGNSFVLPLQVMEEEEVDRLNDAVQSAARKHAQYGHLPVHYRIEPIQTQRNGMHGVAFFRTA